MTEVKKEVTITPEDVTAALDFWKHFKIVPLPGLQEAAEAFCKDPNYENQEVLKLYLCKSITEQPHEAFQDPMFEKIKTECAGVVFDMQFDRDLESALAPEEQK